MGRRGGDPDQLGLFGAPGPAPEPDARGAPAVAAPVHPPPTADLVGREARRFMDPPLPDEAARLRIREDLGTNLLVEAGAGSGKTTALIERMVALVASGTAAVDELAAVTFTRKAAAELRQRFQTELERAIRGAREGDDGERTARLDTALRGVDRAFIGTIHAFCARLLRERPVEAGVDPGFRELLGHEELRLRRQFWRDHLERLSAADDPDVAGLATVGLVPSQLEPLFDELVANPDVVFPSDPVAPPDAAQVDRVRSRLNSLLDRGRGLLPTDVPEKGWDNLQSRLKVLLFLRRVMDWSDRASFLDTLGAEFHGRSFNVTKNRWPDGDAARGLEADWGALRNGEADAVLDRWWAHRYPIAIRFARRAAEAFAAERRRTGRLNFQDLLMLAAGLLRDHPRAREELGRRYRRLLVDEFQDTDPVQAEVLMLLASPADPRLWHDAEPRPGALFVVGDPKQSIYRFRRADIAVYTLVRDRFQSFGDVIELVANFRSLPPVAELVDDVFGRQGRFGETATSYQAAFAPLRARRLPDPDRQRIADFVIDPPNRSHSAAAEDGAARLSAWIAGEISAGRRSPADFLVLARQKAELATYARWLERWRVPVQVTGAGVDEVEEVRELLVLLDALADPTNPVRVAAVLVGLFFGLDLDRLLAWSLGEDLPEEQRRQRGRRFDLTMDPDDDTDVGRALRTLRRWWNESRTHPADILVGRIVDEIGLLPLAAARELGELRAGAVRFALDALRVAALAGDTSVAAAADALRLALESDEAEAPLEPVRRNAVRIMTLHQAKGLEAPVVALVQPVGARPHPVVRHVERRPDGSAAGYLVVQERPTRYRVVTIARPAAWPEKEKEEERYDEAEQDRLLYVAATRAGEVLVVARQPGEETRSPWSGLYPWIDRSGARLALEPVPAPEPEEVDVEPAAVLRRLEALTGARRRRAKPGYRVHTVTTLARAGSEPTGKGTQIIETQPPEPPEPREGPDPTFRGLSWGSAVHAALDAAARGSRGDRLRTVCRGILLETERPISAGRPVELDELVDLVERVLDSDPWRRAAAADRVLSEVPFALHDAAGAVVEPGTAGAGPDDGAAAPDLVEGVIDLAFREDGGWVIVDYKTDVGTDAGFERRREGYRNQVDLYAAVWSRLTGDPVRERILFYTARNEQERW